MKLDLYDFYRLVNSHNIIFCYSGPIIQEGLEGISQTLRRKLEADDVDFSSSQAIFSIFIEQMQNILNYSAERQTYIHGDLEDALSVGIFLIGYAGDQYFIFCGNKILTEDVPYLTNKIEEIRNLSKEELNQLYRMRRKMDPAKSSKGAGLGLIEVAKRSGKPMEYTFKNVDDKFSFFSLHVTVEPKERSEY